MPESYPFEHTLSRLDDIDEWLKSLGFGPQDRIRRYRQNIREMLGIQSRNDINMFLNTSEEKAREVLWSYVEADEFVRAVEPLRSCLGDDLAVAPIDKALKGPADLFLENQANSQGRNFMFELIIGGRLAKAGFLPSFNSGPDLQFEFEHCLVAVQCKRPLSIDGMESNISKAISQLKTDKADLSLIAISVSRLLNPGDPDKIPTVSNPDAGQKYLDDMGRYIADRTGRFWYGKLDRSGILFYGFTPIRWLQNNGHYGHTMLRLETLCPTASDDATRPPIQRLARAIGA